MLDEWASSSERADFGSGQQTASLLGDNAESRIFTLDLLEQNAARGHGLVTCMAAGNNAVLVGTNKGWIIRHDFGGGTPLEMDLSTSRGLDNYVHKVFLDPSGRHCLANVRSGSSADTFYVHAKWKKARVVTRLKGAIINAVAWNRTQISEGSSGELIIGTAGGQIYETLLEEKDKKEKYFKLLYELTEVIEPITGLQLDNICTTSLTRYFVMVVTPTKLYAFSGFGSLEAVFASYSDRTVKCTEFPGESKNSELHFFGKRHAESFAWLARPGIYHGNLTVSTHQSEDNFIGSKWLLEYAKLNGDGSDTQPLAMSLTEHHFLLLCEGRLKAVNRLSQKVAEEEDLSIHSDSKMLGICADYAAGAYYLYNDASIFEITVNDEDRDIWRIYLELREYGAALEHCKNSSQRDIVYEAQANAAFDEKEYTIAASFFAKIHSAVTFEEIALKFWKINELDALRTFLLRKLDSLGKDDRSQITMISTWAIELYLHKINNFWVNDFKENQESSNINSEYEDIMKEFKAFLSDYKDVVDEAATVKLLSSCGRNEELVVYFAGLRNQYETVLNHYIQQRNAKKALSVLKRGNVAPQLVYKAAPTLMMLDAKETVDFLMSAKELNPQELIPALMRHSNAPRAADEAHQALRYLEFCIQRQHNEDQTVHNFMVLLLAKQDDEKALMRFLQSSHSRGNAMYNRNYALRVCLEEKRMEACVFLYSMMGLHEEAVALALKFNLELAKLEAERVEDDEELRKKLWLLIAKHVIKQENGTKKAVAFLKETNDLLKIEDILPFFPDFTLINDFQEPICVSLQEYKNRIEELKLEMNESTVGAEKLRRDVNAVSQRCAILKPDEECGVCKGRVAVQASKDYWFPCGHCFHCDCLMNYVGLHAEEKKDRIMELKKKLSVLTATSSSKNEKATQKEKDDILSSLEQVQASLDDIVAGECPFCGELMIREIDCAFVSANEADSWHIHS